MVAINSIGHSTRAKVRIVQFFRGSSPNQKCYAKRPSRPNHRPLTPWLGIDPETRVDCDFPFATFSTGLHTANLNPDMTRVEITLHTIFRGGTVSFVIINEARPGADVLSSESTRPLDRGGPLVLWIYWGFSDTKLQQSAPFVWRRDLASTS